MHKIIIIIIIFIVILIIYKKIDFYKKFVFLHIPADKIFLSRCYDNLKNKQNFKEEYFDYTKNLRNITRLKISNLLPNKLKGKLKYFIYK